MDTVGVAEHYAEKLRKLFPTMKITVCSKCDAIYPICSAGSICAKVTRDYETANPVLLEPGLTLECNWGSGYPSGRLYTSAHHTLTRCSQIKCVRIGLTRISCLCLVSRVL